MTDAFPLFFALLEALEVLFGDLFGSRGGGRGLGVEPLTVLGHVKVVGHLAGGSLGLVDDAGPSRAAVLGDKLGIIGIGRGHRVGHGSGWLCGCGGV